MIPYLGVSVYRLVQLVITVVVIHFEFVGFHGRGFPSFASMSLYCGRLYRAIGVTFSHRKTRQVCHILPAISTFFDSTLLADLYPQPKGGGLRSEDLII